MKTRDLGATQIITKEGDSTEVWSKMEGFENNFARQDAKNQSNQQNIKHKMKGTKSRSVNDSSPSQIQ